MTQLIEERRTGRGSSADRNTDGKEVSFMENLSNLMQKIEHIELQGDSFVLEMESPRVCA